MLMNILSEWEIIVSKWISTHWLCVHFTETTSAICNNNVNVEVCSGIVILLEITTTTNGN